MIPATRAQELAALYDDHSDESAPIKAIAQTGQIYGHNHRRNSLRYLVGRMTGATVRECREIRALMDFVVHAPVARPDTSDVVVIAR